MDIELYDLVVVSKADDTIVYEVQELKEGVASLTYQSGYRSVSGGTVPRHLLMKPTKTQLSNSGLL